MKLYFDIGNSNIKLNYEIDGFNKYKYYFTNLEYTEDVLYELMPNEIKDKKIEKIIICSVVPSINNIINSVVKKYFKCETLKIDYPVKTGIKIGVDYSKDVGQDIIALSALAASKYENSIIINMGTATTISHIKDKTFLGTIIMPGLSLQLNSIINKANKLSQIELKYIDKKIGKNTDESLNIGIVNAHILAIKTFVKNINPNLPIIISGRLASIVNKKLNYEYIEEATIEGMKIIEILNEK